ncbi:type I restriction endonuclease subunit S [Sutcliffiella cohnii]|uniref:Type I restriction endonuclease subunit S n=1 Tax=Sutcliffiella cohnii TaxID=33932 RepID=A0A223KNI9_9BACI|nr:restriction endonuclease subunit S [Sutcliffiella cohnii]AST91075.1 type I restriction endonuclease subunit S [Sutcliffiella cohnii]
MKLNKLGNYIELVDIRNRDNLLTKDAIVGISTQKEFIPTKADLEGVNLVSYKIVPPHCFAFVADTSRRGDKMSLAYNKTNNDLLVSSISTIFKISSTEKLLSDYLYIYFKRPEFDRYARFNSWGSARETFSWDDMCDIDIDLPSLPIQQKYVDIYNAMLANQQSYERGLEDLKLVCDAYIEDLRRKMPCKRIGKYIERYDVRNGEKGTRNVMGISINKEFRIPTSKVNRNALANYKVVKPRQIAFVQTTHNEKVFAYALNNTSEDIVVSSVNEVFSTDETQLLPEYLSMFFNRTEFDRYARYHSWGSARETFTWNDLIEVEIPIPDIKVQHAIADIYTAYIARKKINEKLKAQLKDLCPVLIKGSLEEAKKV